MDGRLLALELTVMFMYDYSPFVEIDKTEPLVLLFTENICLILHLSDSTPRIFF